jgi:hypothetical protein
VKRSAQKSVRPKFPAEAFRGQPAAIRTLAQALRKLTLGMRPKLTENAYGGAKVRLTLYSLGPPADVVCGIQPAKDGCLFYLHQVRPEDSTIVKICGQGKHARQIRISSLPPAIARELRRLVALAMERAARK